MSYRFGDEIEVVIDRDGLGMDEGVGHLPDETMVIISGAGGKVGEAVRATVLALESTRLGSSILAQVQ